MLIDYNRNIIIEEFFSEFVITSYGCHFLRKPEKSKNLKQLLKAAVISPVWFEFDNSNT